MPKTDELRGVSDAIVGDGLVFVQSGYCDNNVVTALNATTGAVVWRTDPDVRIDEISHPRGVQVVVANGVIVVPSLGRLVGLDTATGKARWMTEVDQRAAESEAVVVGWSPISGLVGVLDRLTGKQQWSVRTSPPLRQTTPTGPPQRGDVPPSVSAAVDKERVYIRVDSDVTAYDAMTGKKRWSASVGSWDGAVLLRGLDVLLTQSNGGIVALDAADGQERWFFPNNTGTEQLELSDTAVADGNLYMSDGSSATALDLATGKPRWSKPNLSMSYMLASGDGRVLLSGAGRLHLLDAATGNELWADSVPADPQRLGAAVYTLDRDNLYLAWSCGGG